MTKQDLESISNLIKACRLCGAVYKANSITFPDGLVLKIQDCREYWFLHDQQHKLSLDINKTCSPEHIQFQLLESHLRFLRNNLACW